MKKDKSTQHDLTAIRLARKGCDGALHLVGIAVIYQAQLHPQRRRHGLDPPNRPIWAAMVGSRKTAARVTRGAISLSSASHFGLSPYSKTVKPVVLPPGRARPVTKPVPTGSMTCTNTIGTLRVSRCSAATIVEVATTTTSGASATNSAAYWR